MAFCRESGVSRLLSEDRDFDRFKGSKMERFGPRTRGVAWQGAPIASSLATRADFHDTGRAAERNGRRSSHSSSFDQRRRPDTLRTAMATAFFWPTNTTRRLPRVTPV